VIADVATAILAVATVAWAVGLGVWAFREATK
jgi:hypothetical protein